MQVENIATDINQTLNEYKKTHVFIDKYVKSLTEEFESIQQFLHNLHWLSPPISI